MDVYKPILNQLRSEFKAEGNKKAALKTKKIMDRYLDLLMESLFNRMKYNQGKDIQFKVSIYPIAYLSYNLKRVSVFSRLHPYYLFKVSMSWPLLRTNMFTFKPMKKLYFKFREMVLDTEKVYKIIEQHESSII